MATKLRSLTCRLAIAVVLTLSCKRAEDHHAEETGPSPDELASAAPSRGLSDVCPAGNASDPLLLVDRSYVADESERARGLPLSEGGLYELRLAAYDARTGERQYRLLIDRQDPNGGTARHSTSCLGVDGDRVWLWSSHDWLHGRSKSNGELQVEEGTIAKAPELAGELADFGFSVEKQKLIVKSKSAKAFMVGEGEALIAVARPSLLTERRLGAVDRPRIHGATEVEGLVEPESSACAVYAARRARTDPQAASDAIAPCWQTTTDNKRHYYFGETEIHAFDAESKQLLWSVAY